MTIEFYTAPNKVKEWIISYVEEKLTEMYQKLSDIARAEVTFKEENENEKSCEITLTIFGDSIFMTGSDTSFEMASRKAIEMLEKEIDVLVKNRVQPPNEITSTVRV